MRVTGGHDASVTVVVTTPKIVILDSYPHKNELQGSVVENFLGMEDILYGTYSHEASKGVSLV